MSVRDTRREAALQRLADHLLGAGLARSSLKSLAAAAGTSDRMLLYYFADKDELLTAVLGEVAGRMLPLLEDGGAGAAPRPYEVLLTELGQVLARPDIRPFMRLWLELAAFAARGEQPHLTIAGLMADSFSAWILARLATAPGEDRAALAARLLATVDGSALLSAVGREAMAEAAVSGSSVKIGGQPV